MKSIKLHTIKEASELSGLPESTLRYYESIGLIDPINRDPSSKHRVYGEDDINLIIAVACLSATGCPSRICVHTSGTEITEAEPPMSRLPC